MYGKTKFPVLFISLVIFFLLLPCNSSAKTTIEESAALQTLFRQAETTYMKPMGFSAEQAVNQDPEVFAMLVGLTLQRQFKYLQNNTKYIPQFRALENEVIIFLKQLAEIHNNRHPTDGSDLSSTRLEIQFYNALNGNINQGLIAQMGINPATVSMPFMLTQVQISQSIEDYSNGKLQIMPNEINLFGVKAPPVKSRESMNFGQVLPDNSKDVPPPDVILGTWESPRKPISLTFHKKGNNYVATTVKHIKLSRKKHYTLTTVYTAYASEARFVFGYERIYYMKIQNICEPMVNTYECRHSVEDTTFPIVFNRKYGCYQVAMGTPGFEFWRKR